MIADRSGPRQLLNNYLRNRPVIADKKQIRKTNVRILRKEKKRPRESSIINSIHYPVHNTVPFCPEMYGTLWYQHVWASTRNTEGSFSFPHRAVSSIAAECYLAASPHQSEGNAVRSRPNAPQHDVQLAAQAIAKKNKTRRSVGSATDRKKNRVPCHASDDADRQLP